MPGAWLKKNQTQKWAAHLGEGAAPSFYQIIAKIIWVKWSGSNKAASFLCFFNTLLFQHRNDGEGGGTMLTPKQETPAPT